MCRAFKAALDAMDVAEAQEVEAVLSAIERCGQVASSNTRLQPCRMHAMALARHLQERQAAASALALALASTLLQGMSTCMAG